MSESPVEPSGALPASDDGPSAVSEDLRNRPPQELLDKLEELPPPVRTQAARAFQLLVQQQMSGPLPAASEFSKYEATLPGAANRIVSMTEQEQAHRHRLEERGFESNRRTTLIGQLLAFGALIASLLVVSLFCLMGHPIEGAGLGGAIIVAIVALFLGRRSGGSTEAGASEKEDD